MNGSSKILTVSYGTFSCTLEGFDDPLGTMRELAEYFRDLAADDRYFGAEPPTPDVEMLQNIAQRDVHRKVEARTSATGIALTQVAEADAPKAEIPPAEEKPTLEETAPKPPAQANPDAGPLTFDDDYLMADEPEDVLAVDPGAAPVSDVPAETVAEKLRRIRAVVSRRPDAQSFSVPQAPDATGKRDRAMTETIRQIQDDLSDDEAAPLENASDGIQPFEVKAEDTPLPKAEAAAPDAPQGEDGFEEDLEEDAFAPAEPAPVDDVDSDDDDERSVSQFLENVSEKIGDVAPTEPAPAPNPLSIENTDADVGRLLEETDSKLNEDGVVRRRQVISQMRAAVAATKADRAVTRLISPEVQDEVEKKAYRNDLSDAVSETQSLPKQTARKPSGPPLVLVSSQRVSETLTQTDAAIASKKAAEPGDDFASFVEMNGADGLEELLEAAAAFTIFAQGQDSFSRPEIMKRVAMIDPALPITREDGLRSFGQLLRQGKFQKLDRGQFTIDQETRFNPENRIAGE